MNTADLRRLTVGLENAERVLAVAQSRAINRVAGKARTKLQRSITSTVNLKAAYVRERMKLSRATPAKPSATIESRERSTRLARFPNVQHSRSIKRGRKPSQLRRLKGDPLRRISPGRRAAGVKVKVRKGGGLKLMPGAFLIPLRAGRAAGGNGFGIFIRTGRGRGAIERKYSMSVAAWARALADDDDFAADLREQIDEAMRRQISYEIGRALRR
ncbi:MAG: phage tail protein [Rhodocyclaceae bacterium]|nr:phage tail protein [Rhodocyclaceae bacterium]